MRPYLEILRIDADWTDTRPSQRSTWASAAWTAWSSGDFLFQKSSTRTLLWRIALATGLGRPARSRLDFAGAAGVVDGAEPFVDLVPAADSPASTPSTLSCALSWPSAAATAPWATCATLPGWLTAGAPVCTFGA